MKWLISLWKLFSVALGDFSRVYEIDNDVVSGVWAWDLHFLTEKAYITNLRCWKRQRFMEGQEGLMKDIIIVHDGKKTFWHLTQVRIQKVEYRWVTLMEVKTKITDVHL